MCTVTGGVTTPAECTMRPSSQLVKLYKIALCASKPDGPTASSAVNFNGKGCSTMLDDAAGQQVDYSAGAATLTGSTRPAAGTYRYLYLELGKTFKFKASVKLAKTQVGGVLVTAAGTGYASSDTVTLSGGGCTTTPTAEVTSVDSSGGVTEIHITDPGVGCSSAPSVSISGGSGGSGGASALAYLGGVSSAGSTAGARPTNGEYCWTKAGADSTIFYPYSNYSDPWQEPVVIECGDSLPAENAMGYNTQQWNGFGNQTSVINAPVSDGSPSGAGRTNAMDAYVIKSDGMSPSAISPDVDNGVERVSGIIQLAADVTVVDGVGTPTLGFNNSRGTKVNMTKYTTPSRNYQQGMVLRFEGAPIDATFTMK